MRRLRLFILCLVNFVSSRDVIELHFLFFVISGGDVVQVISLPTMIFDDIVLQVSDFASFLFILSV